MYSGIVRTALTNTLPLEHDYREPREVRPDAKAQEGAVNCEEYFARLQALIVGNFKRLLHQI